MNTQHIQARLTVLGFNLSLLIFVTASLISIANSEKSLAEAPWVYLESLTAISLGFLFSLFGIVAFLRAQSSSSAGWFTTGQLLLYFGLSQFLASGMNNLLFTITHDALREHAGGAENVIKYILVMMAESLWLGLLFAGPMVELREHAKAQELRTQPQKATLQRFVYWLLLTTTFLVDGCTYYVRGDHRGLLWLVWMVVAQVGQPFLWLS